MCSIEPTKRVAKSSHLMDENDVHMSCQVGGQHTGQQTNTRIDGKANNGRRVLAELDDTSNKGSHALSNTLSNTLSNANTKPSAVDLRSAKYIQPRDVKRETRKTSAFTIYSDDCKAEQTREPNADSIALDSLAIDEEGEVVVIKEMAEVSVSCEESLMLVESDDSNSESNCEQTSDILSTSFDSLIIRRCKEYCNEIHDYLLDYERKLTPDPFYMAKQPEINCKMRSILIDWMIEVTDEYKLLDETLFLAVSCVDRFLSMMSVSRQSFQLLGTTALFIASKYEEIYPPDLTEFVYITDDSYSKKQILNMEKLVLKALQFDISAPTIHYFLEKYVSDLSLLDSVKCLSEYLCYLTLLESEPFLQYYPSEIAICSIILSAHTLGFRELITDEFIQSTIVLEKSRPNGDIKSLLKERQSCIEALHKMQHFASNHPQQAIQQKYATNKYYNVSLVDAITTSPRIN